MPITIRRFGYATVALALLLGLQAPLSAGCLDVNNPSAFNGDFGLEVTIDPACLPADVVVPPGDVSGDFRARETVTAGASQVIAPGAEFSAGIDVVIDEGFSVDSAAPFTATINELLDSPFGYVQDDTPEDRTDYGVKFYLDLSNLTLTETDLLDVFSAHSADGELQLRATITRNMTLMEDRLILAARVDAGGLVDTVGMELVLPAGYNSIELRWLALGGTGSFVASVNGDAFDGLTDLDNDESRVDLARLGVTGGVGPTTTGTVRLDDFSSFPVASP